MTFPNGGASAIWGKTNPVPSEIQAWGGEVETRLEAAQATFATVAEAQAADIPATVLSVFIDGTTYRKVADEPLHGRSFLHSNGNWYDGVYVPTTGLPELWAYQGQSNILDMAGTAGGDRSVKDGVLVYEHFPASGLVADRGWIIAGPEDIGWWTRPTDPANWSIYHAAYARFLETGRLQCIVGHGAGGTPLWDFTQAGPNGNATPSGQYWSTLQTVWSAALVEALPGRGGETLTDYNRITANFFAFCQGEADADYQGRYTGAQWIAALSAHFDNMLDPSGSSVPIVNEGTILLVSELLRGGTNGGAIGVGDTTDDRNVEINRLPYYAGFSLRDNVRVISTAGLSKYTLDGDEIGSDDNLHFNGAACEERGRRMALAVSRSNARGGDDKTKTVGDWAVIEPIDGYIANAVQFAVTINASSDETFTLPYTAPDLAYGISWNCTASSSSTAVPDIQVTAKSTTGFTLRNVFSSVNGTFNVHVYSYFKA